MPSADSFPIIDMDTHLTEPPDLWTSRVPKKWVDSVPQVRRSADGVDEWWCGNKRLVSPGMFSVAGWKHYAPSTPATFEEMDRACFDPVARLERMDAYGIWAQVLFPNILGFTNYAIEAMEPDLGLACVRAYNDFLVEFCGTDDRRLLALTCLPYWDVKASVAEIERCHDLGHHGIVFGARWERVGMPPLIDPHWDPILSVAQERDLAVNFHINVTGNTLSEWEGSVRGS